ncbi:hypothetical protein MLD38_010146 [Melastoma candidum]|uniref:Uncharacterized protein n=1 Tax=Melastoma candidum TaxID=119954 RepID=A0ACB9QYZ7_9MYRT|nr:hypothetical protein MLD38_010146 [Melastoma candidum]
MKSLLRPSKNITKFAYFLSPDPSPFTSLGTFLGNGPLRLPSSDFAFLRSFSGQRRELSCFLSSPSWRTTLFPVCLSGRGGGNVNGVTGSSFSSGICVPAPPRLQGGQDGEGLVGPLEILRKRLGELGFDISACLIGQKNHLLRPRREIRKKGAYPYLLVQMEFLLHGDVSVANAFAQGKSVSAFNKISRAKIFREITVEGLQLQPLCRELEEYFAERIISLETLRRNVVLQKNWENQIIIAFTYWRKTPVMLSLWKGRLTSFQWKKQASEIVSVPDGAPPSVSKNDFTPEDQDTKYKYLWNCKEYLQTASRIIIETYGDKPGQALAEELARRLGRERCWRVQWPRNDSEYFKDANEVLIYLGRHTLRDVVENAELYPIRGLFSFNDFDDEINAYYHKTLGYEFGAPSGWKSLRHLYNVVPRELTIVTGVPNSGKSEWIDALFCNINASHGWKFVLCSTENKVREHARKLMEKHIKKPFFDTQYGDGVERMSPDEFQQGMQWLNDTFYLIRCEDDSLPSIKWALDLAKSALLSHGVRGLVIDPYNELDHQRSSSQTETEYVSQMLTLIRRFAQHHACHVWFVAHPRQLHNWAGEPPNLYDIKGSAHFINKCDNGIVIHRNRNPEAGPVDQVQVCVRKVRNKVAGIIGNSFLSYNRVTGEFMDITEEPSDG